MVRDGDDEGGAFEDGRDDGAKAKNNTLDFGDEVVGGVTGAQDGDDKGGGQR